MLSHGRSEVLQRAGNPKSAGETSRFLEVLLRLANSNQDALLVCIEPKNPNHVRAHVRAHKEYGRQRMSISETILLQEPRERLRRQLS